MTDKLNRHYSYGGLIKYAAAPAAMMIFTSLYTVVDGFFISNLAGKTAFAAVNLVIPYWMIMCGFGFMFGAGASALCGMLLGEQRRDLANQAFTSIVMASVLFSIVLMIIGLVTLRPVCELMGADAAMMPPCITYGNIVFAFLPTMFLQSLFQPLFSTMQKPALGFYFTLGAGLSNMVLDWVFVGLFGWGVAGAAFATGIGTVVGGVLPLIYVARSHSLTLQLVKCRISMHDVLKSAGNGSSELLSNVSQSVISIFFNWQLLRYAGETGVAAYGIMMYVGFIFVALSMGYMVAVSPLISYQYGAQHHHELTSLYKKSLIICAVSGIIMFIAAELLAEPLARFFGGYDPELYKMTVHGFRIVCILFLLSGFNIFATAFFTALNNGLISGMLAFCRTFLFQLICIFVLPELFGLEGIWLSCVTAEVFALIVSIITLKLQKRRYHY